MGLIKSVDTDTGEVLTFYWDTPDDLARHYTELSGKIKALERAKHKVAAVVKSLMGDEERLEALGGQFKQVHAEHWVYPIEEVREVLGDAPRFFKVDKKAVDLEIAEHVEDAAWQDDIKRLRESMELDKVVNSIRYEKEW